MAKVTFDYDPINFLATKSMIPDYFFNEPPKSLGAYQAGFEALEGEQLQNDIRRQSMEKNKRDMEQETQLTGALGELYSKMSTENPLFVDRVKQERDLRMQLGDLEGASKLNNVALNIESNERAWARQDAKDAEPRMLQTKNGLIFVDTKGRQIVDTISVPGAGGTKAEKPKTARIKQVDPVTNEEFIVEVPVLSKDEAAQRGLKSPEKKLSIVEEFKKRQEEKKAQGANQKSESWSDWFSRLTQGDPSKAVNPQTKIAIDKSRWKRREQ